MNFCTGYIFALWIDYTFSFPTHRLFQLRCNTLFQLASMVENVGDMIGDTDVELKGMPVSVGEVTGMARVVTNLKDAHTIQVSVNIYNIIFMLMSWQSQYQWLASMVAEQSWTGINILMLRSLPCILRRYQSNIIIWHEKSLWLDY